MALENRNVAGKEKNMLASVMDIPLQDAAQALVIIWRMVLL